MAALAPPVTYDLPDRDPIDGTRVIREVSSACRGGAEVALNRIKGGGHI